MVFRRQRAIPEPLNKTAEVVGLDKRQLLTRHVAGDASAFSELVSMYRSQVYTYLVHANVSEGMRDDVFQEIFIALHRSAASYDPGYALEPWIFTVVVNKVRDHFRREQTQRVVPLETVPETHSEGRSDELLSAKQTSSFIEGEIQGLPLEQREVFLFCAVKGMEQKDAAELLGMPVNTVKTNLRRARERLTRALLARKSRINREANS